MCVVYLLYMSVKDVQRQIDRFFLELLFIFFMLFTLQITLTNKQQAKNTQTSTLNTETASFIRSLDIFEM